MAWWCPTWSARGPTVSASEAKPRLSELLRETERGRSFVIRRRGKPVARLVPYVRDEQTTDLSRVLKAFCEIPGRVSGQVKVRRLIEEGRRFWWPAACPGRQRAGREPDSPVGPRCAGSSPA